MSELVKAKECFVIMPISDNIDYPEGHFDRVYNYLIKPACEQAGFRPIRADDVINTNYIALDIVKRIIESDMSICDLSTQNPNVLYELGIRQAFNKPVTLIKDKNTKRIFDIQGFRDFEYDFNLRIDNVRMEIDNLSQLIVNTYEANGEEINSLVSLLSITPAKQKENKKISPETELILNSLATLDKRMTSIEKNGLINSPERVFNKYRYPATFKEDNSVPRDVGDFLDLEEISKLKTGDMVYHIRFGYGRVIKITEIESVPLKSYKGDIDFESGVKSILLTQKGLIRGII